MKRKILIPVDSILALLIDYTKGTNDIPADATPISLQVNPAEKGMFGLMVESPQFKDDAPIRVDFQIKRVYGVV